MFDPVFDAREHGLSSLADVTLPGALALALLEVGRFVVVILNPARRILYVNPFFEELSHYTRDELVGRDWFEACVPDEFAPRLGPLFVRAIAGEPTRGNVNPIRIKDGSTRVIEWYDRTLNDAHGHVTALLVIGQDITARVQAVEALADIHSELEARVARRTAEFEAMFGATTVAIAYLDRELRFVRVNRAYAAADHHDPAYFVGKLHFELFPHADNQRLFEQVRDSGRPHTALAKPFEYAHNPERGVSHWDWTLTPVLDGDGRVEGLVLVLQDVTARIEAIETLHQKEQRIAEQLAEKELLLREIHHRVKNNLQVVSSLLYLQSLEFENAAAASRFDECRSRIRAMSLVHEVLCESAALERVDFSAYLEQLIGALRRAYAPPELRLAIDVDVRVDDLDIDRAVSCGLIASELVTNALKHAFVGRSHARLWIHLRAESPACWRLEIGDDGVGLADGGTHSVGLRLVHTLVRQLDGTLHVDGDGGTRVCVSFPAPSARI